MYSTLITVPQLQTLLTTPNKVMVFDCSGDLIQPGAGDAQYAQAHIPGAVRADLDRHLSTSKDTPDAASGGRHPLPSREIFAAWLSSIGFDNATQAVVYDRQGANYCGRLWWMLKWAGHEAVAVLDGGWQAWLAHGGVSASGVPEVGEPQRPTSNYFLAAAQTKLVATETVAGQLGRPEQTLIDARSAPRYRGEVEPMDPVAGHIPGALNRPFANNLNADGCFKPADQLRTEFEALLAGRDPATVVHHCGSGVSAIPNLLAMEVAGLGRTALYAGSWSAWCNTLGLPCAQG